MLQRLLLCCTLLGAAAVSQAREPAAPGCGLLSVGFYDHGALHYRGAEGGWTGIDQDVVNELARRSGCRFFPLTESRVRIWAMLQSGALDMTVSGIATPERHKYARFVPYLAARNYLLLPKGVAAKVRNLDEFLADPGYKIGVVKSFKHGPTYDAWLDKLRAQGRVYDVAEYTALIKLLKIGRVQAVLSLATSWGQLFKNPEFSDAFRAMDWAPKDTLVGALVLSRQSVPLETVELFDKHLREMRADGTLRAIFERHVDADLAAGMLNYPNEPDADAHD
ncbi:polar amino acid transport system substrate-binding protein [Janthinobacterium sp. CG_23.3]|uniref:substrate-binding periplasmic protein n=1 Tax=Janthinobacterium sp. CG_23.3 TaxID=3349634 RepID=UPI0038D3F449